MTSALYQRINGSAYRHIYLAGDLHGCLSLLGEQLEKAAFDPERDLLLSVGDLADRGPDSVGCLQLMNEPWFACVRGNHEQMAIDAVNGENVSRWLRNGGDWYYSLEERAQKKARTLIRQADSLPHVIELATCEGKLIVIAHADYTSNDYAFGKPLDGYEIIWNRDRVNFSLAGRHQLISGADAFYFGHTPVEPAMQFSNQFYIDTGAVFGGYLTLRQLQ
ncbi:serine/threonine-protein phosphatase [Rahnella sp. AA]|uniref:metallophosphoesterase n=1 Tax=Rahnella sp. AA TaxID=2057180 RepID=UPI000C33CE6F|nr:metallophosphoesterase [Rahnella sp. AA]PKE30418.1 serine/threonine-protein phosphatase [Rahnella sp. AA]